MNELQWYIFGANFKRNTYIGGIGATINTSTLLSQRLGINVYRIKNVKVVGNDVHFRVNGTYTMPMDAFSANTNITYFDDPTGRCINFQPHPFRNGCTKLLWVNFPKVISLQRQTFQGATIFKEARFDSLTHIYAHANFAGPMTIIYAPKLIQFGDTVGDNLNLSSVSSGCQITVNVALQTCNAGGPDGDIAVATSRGAVIAYITP